MKSDIDKPFSHKNAFQQLDNLQHGAVVLDVFENAWQQGRAGRVASGYWYRAYGDSTEVSTWDLSFKGPFKTLWKGTP